METIHPAMIYDPGPLDNNDNLSKNFYNNHQQQQQHHPELEHLAKTMPKPTIINNNNNNDESNSTKSPSNNSTNIRSQSRMSISHDKGLLNMPGQNNCFLNSAVQVLWHLDIFRRSFRELQGHACMGDSCIFCALKELFNQFQSSTESALPPDSLRFALAQAFSDQQLDSKSQCSSHCIPHEKFSMNLFEQKMCGARMNIEKRLLNRPDIISIGLVWDTDHPSLTFIRNVYQLIGTNIRLNELFNLKETNSFHHQQQLDDNQQLNLVGLVTYYGKHYSTYIFNTKLSQWIYFDDATVRVVGSQWQQVVEKCIKGHFQPLLLLYSNPNAKIINTKNALKEIIPMTVIKKPVVDEIEPSLSVNSSSNIVNPLPPTTITTRKSPIPPPIPPHNLLSSYVKPKSTETTTNINNSKLDTISHHSNHHQQKQHPALYRHNVAHYNSDVPDSPSATSTTSYFSDVGADSTDGYISRKTVENIIKIQQRSTKTSQNLLKLDNHSSTMLNNGVYDDRKYNRNSSSSIESFDLVVRSSKISSTLSTTSMMMNQINSCLLQRRDSGNSDRASSVSSNDTSYQRQQLMTKNSNRNTSTAKNASDQGYDSFSLSSSDSYPSTISPSKLNSRLKQIPEDDSQLIDMVNNLSTIDECDKLCSEADILLLRSHEKEREGDLRAAAALSDSAAAKARLAMDIPYSNHQTLISAKMKHSMCVMRSASLHKRVVELETEEKRLLKAAALEAASHHSRQSSRDSSYGRHSRQSSRDNKDPTKVITTYKQDASIDNRINAVKSKSDSKNHWPSLEIYATLPKKSKSKSNTKNSISVENVTNKLKDNATKSMIASRDHQLIYENLQMIKPQTKSNKTSSKSKVSLISDSEFSDYHSEWEAIHKKRPKTKINDPISNTGWQSCRENTDSDAGYAEFASSHVSSKSSLNSKKISPKSQCKVKRKLMFGNFLKSKNQSLPDLREDIQQSNKNETPEGNKCKDDDSIHRSSAIAQINAKGFHQLHRSSVAEQGFRSKPLLIKVKPPAVINGSNKPLPPLPCTPSPSTLNTEQIKHQHNESSKNEQIALIATTTNTITTQMKSDCVRREKPLPPKRNLFLEELNRKRSEILKCEKQINSVDNNDHNNEKIYSNIQPKPIQSLSNNGQLIQDKKELKSTAGSGPTPVPVISRKPSMFEITNFISKNSPPLSSHQNIDHNQNITKSTSSSSTKVHMPIPVNPRSNRLQRPPDYETTIKRLNQKQSNPIYSNLPPPSPTISMIMNLEQRTNFNDQVISSSITANHHQQQVNQTQTYHTSSNDKKIPMQRNNKKSVKFSDQIELVACADDVIEHDEPLPNLLLEKVLGKTQNIVYTLQK
ncbi:ubiquitinyl hydrolase [Dermatophagoides pteronyssinus]|uniref:Ubiquitinyl hydrolase n=1 Tax=Dermatophagoides pteronyssinus TaxID=6956 RepID=A0ABQ8JBL5_DERPT|nr:ubiquitinyl hydrolase [Dermatophagoides pteronyssinus]